jgi:hypothetical protein
MLGILGFVGKGAAPLLRQLGVEAAGRFFCLFVFFSFSALLGIIGCVASRSSEVVSPCD